jgi:phenylacetic acid degradation operon negative regulatory protein
MKRLRVSERLLFGTALGGEVLEKLIGGGSRAYPTHKLYFWTPAGYSRKKYRQLVNRMVRLHQLHQVVIEGQVSFRLGTAGRQQLLDGYPVLKFCNAAWDGWWRIVMFDVPESKRGLRDNLRRELARRAFGRLQDSAYLSPFELEKSFLDWLEEKKLAPMVTLLEARQKHLGDPKDLAAKVWRFDHLAKRYQAIIDKLTTRFGIREAKKRADFIRKVYGEYLQVVAEDPQLPPELLPDKWPANKCRRYVLPAASLGE